MLKVIDGKIYVNNIETNDTELIGNAFKDFADENPNGTLHMVNDNKLLSIIENQCELRELGRFVSKEMTDKCIPCEHTPDFKYNWRSTFILYNLLMMIKKEELIFKPKP